MKLSPVIKSSRWVFSSVLVHILVVGSLLFLSHRAVIGVLGGGDLGQSAQKKTGTLEGEGVLKEVHLYDGISYSEYSAHRAKEAAQQKASQLLGKLQNMNFGKPGTTAPKEKFVDVKAPELADVKRNETLTAMVDRQKLDIKEPVAPANKPANRKMSDQERGELRKKFRALETEFRKAYGRALTQDPHLNVTVAFEAEIQPSGYLMLSSFKARGAYLPQSLDMLKNEMSNLIGKVYVTKDLSGALIRGESIFVR